MARFLRSVFSLLTFLLFTNGYTQVTFENKASHVFTDYAQEIVTVSNFNFVKTHIYTDYYFDTASIYGYDQSGALKFVKKFNGSPLSQIESTFIDQIVRSGPNTITMCGFGRQCDFVTSNQQLFFTKLDTLGNILFFNTYTNPYPTMMQGYFSGLVQYSDSSYFAMSDSLLYHFNKFGALVKVKNTTFNDCSSMLKLNNNHFLLSAKTGTLSKLVEIDTNGVAINQVNCSYSFSKLLQNNSGDLFGLTTTSVIAKISPSYTVTSTSQSSQGMNNSINDIANENDTIYCSGVKSTNEFLFYKYDQNLNLTYNTQYNSKYINPVKLTVNNNGNVVFLNSERSSYLYSNFYQSLIFTNKQANFIITPDAGVTDFTLDSGYVNTTSLGSPPFPLIGHFRLKAKVHNYSSDTLRSFYINHKTLAIPANCGFFFKHQCYSGLAVPPGGDTYVTTPWLYEGGPVAGTMPAPGALIGFNACIWTSAPDDASDNNHTNDDYCKSISMPFITGINDNESITENAEAYPNPFHDLITIKPNYNSRIEIFDIHGRQLKFVDVKAKEKISLEMSDLNAGIYILKIQGDTFSKTIKVVKQ